MSSRPFESIGRALEAWHSGDVRRAEGLFREGIEAYRRNEPEGMDFALGQFATFLLDQARIDEAFVILEQAIERNTDIPAIWNEYLRLLVGRHDLEAFKRGMQAMSGLTKSHFEPEFVLEHARRADRENAPAFAEALARWVVDKCTKEGDDKGRWAAIGDFGRILERAGRLDEAVAAWREVFDEGSVDPDTASRLSMHFEKAGDYASAMVVIRKALSRGLPASAEETLRKRLLRCERKIAGKTRLRPAKSDVPAYSVRRASDRFEQIFQIRTKSAIRDLNVVENVARCLVTSKNASALIDIDLATGSEVRRVDNLPLLEDISFAPDGRGIGTRRTAAVGQGPTLLRFVNPDGHVVAESAIPDATSQVALGDGLWYVGCRDGHLYAFGLDGRLRWTWETPGSRGYTDSSYFRPCPYLVTSQPPCVVVASMGNIYAVAPNGETRWHAALPDEHQTRWRFTLPLKGDRLDDEPFGILGLTRDASRDQVKSAYRRLALATHPDRNPKDFMAAEKFRLIQGAYERILAAPLPVGASAGITVTIELSGAGPTVSFVTAAAEDLGVGSSQGRLYTFGKKGDLREARVLGDGPVRAALRPDGTVGAAWCSNALLIFKNNTIVNATEAIDWPRGLAMLGDDVVLWRGNDIHVFDPDGGRSWSVEFSKNITGVAIHDGTLLCAAGALVAFRRLRSA